MESTRVTILVKLLLLVSSLFLLQALSPTSASPTAALPEESLPAKSGYLPVNPSTGSAIFFTFYEAQEPLTPLSDTPLLIWLQGGPGCSSMIGNFYELGPWRVTSHAQNVEHLVLEPNQGSWNRLFGLLFLDNPIGAGFSIAATPDEIPTDQETVAEHLFRAVKEFLKLDPLFKSRPIYFTGESYAGKYVPSIGYYIIKKNMELPVEERVELAGVAIGNGLTDPEIQVGTHAVNAYFSGLINEKQKAELEKIQIEAIKLTKMRNWSAAADARSRVLRSLQNMTGLATLYDFTRRVPYETGLVTDFLKSKEVRAALGAEEWIELEECSVKVGEMLHGDVMKSVKYKVEFLLKKSNSIKVLVYQGQHDLRDGVVSTEAWMKTVRWEGMESFLMAERKVWRVEGVTAGYVQKWGRLSHAVVLGAGHLVPTDQPLHSQAMIEDWVLDQGLFHHTTPSSYANPAI